MKKDSKSSLDDITVMIQPGLKLETFDSAQVSCTSIYTPYPLYQQKIRALLKPPDYQRNAPKFMTVREPRSEFEKKEAAVQVKLLKKTFNNMHQRFCSVDKVLTMLKSESIKINSLRTVGENDLHQLQQRLDELQAEENMMLEKICDEFKNNAVFKHVRERMRLTLMHLEVKNQYLGEQIRMREFLIGSENRRRTKTLENKFTKVQAYKNLRKTVGLDVKDRSADLDLLEEDIETREKIHELRKKRIKKYEEIAETAANEERDFKNNSKREAVLLSTLWGRYLSTTFKNSKSKFGFIESAFEKIKSNTLAQDMPDVVSRFLVKEQSLAELMAVLKHSKDKCEKLIGKNDLIEGKIDSLLLGQKPGFDVNIANKKESTHLAIVRAGKAKERLARMKLVYDKIRGWSEKLINKLGLEVVRKEKIGKMMGRIRVEILRRLGRRERKMFVTEL